MKYEMTAVFSQREGLAFNDALAETLDTTADKLVPEAVARWYGGSEDAFRAAVCEQAKKYMGTEYRWGGKSGRGIDCSGLVSSAYMQCGVLIYRDAKIIEGWPMHEVAFENKSPAMLSSSPAMWRFIWAKGGISTPPVPPSAAVWSSTALSRATRCIGRIW